MASMRVMNFRDGMEDYEYLHLLKRLTAVWQAKGFDRENPALIQRAKTLLRVDNSLIVSLKEYTNDGKLLRQRRNDLAKVIEEMMEKIK